MRSFWEVVELKNIGMVATVAHTIGEDCGFYFPMEKSKSLTFGDYQITLAKE